MRNENCEIVYRLEECLPDTLRVVIRLAKRTERWIDNESCVSINL